MVSLPKQDLNWEQKALILPDILLFGPCWNFLFRKSYMFVMIMIQCVVQYSAAFSSLVWRLGDSPNVEGLP